MQVTEYTQNLIAEMNAKASKEHDERIHDIATCIVTISKLDGSPLDPFTMFVKGYLFGEADANLRKQPDISMHEMD